MRPAGLRSHVADYPRLVSRNTLGHEQGQPTPHTAAKDEVPSVREHARMEPVLLLHPHLHAKEELLDTRVGGDHPAEAVAETLGRPNS